jgi:hypothetical protein
MKTGCVGKRRVGPWPSGRRGGQACLTLAQLPACSLCQTACTGNRQIALHFLVLLCLSGVTANRLTDHVPVCLDRSGSTETLPERKYCLKIAYKLAIFIWPDKSKKILKY